MIHTSEAILAVSDIRETVRFYREVLGFESEWLWQDPPTFGGVRWGKVHVMFCLQPALAGKTEGHMHFFHVDDVRSMYEQHRARNAPIISDLENKPWGLCEYTVRDPNGYHLRFAGSPTFVPKATATQSLPEHIRLELRSPKVGEYVRITKSVGWNCKPEMMEDVLKRSVLSVVAIDTGDDQAIGMVRVCGDGKFFTFWDVCVDPRYQQQRIGSAMMERALEELRKIGPKGAFVGLFTHSTQFYERLGFTKDIGMHLAL